MPASVKIKLGDTEIEIPRPTFGQLERIADWLAEFPTDTKLKNILQHNRKLLAVGLERSKPIYNDDQIAEMEMSVTDLRDAVSSILGIAGLVFEAPAVPEATPPLGGLETSLTASSENLPPAADTRLN
jgi:hypothetical protein